MKRAVFYIIAVLGLPLIVVLTAFDPPEDQYIVISWNDLGMHCSGQYYQNLCILPPYNNLKSHVILRGVLQPYPSWSQTGLRSLMKFRGTLIQSGRPISGHM